MEYLWQFVRLFLGLLLLKLCGGYPIDLESADVRNVTFWTTLPPFLAFAFLVTSVVLLVGCICCRQNKASRDVRVSSESPDEFTDSTSSHSLSGTGGYVNNAASTTEFTIFPPVQATAASSTRLSVPGDRSSVVRFEPLPDIRLPQTHGRRPAAFNNVVTHGLSSQDWFQEPHVNFPRQQLKYLRELGCGWFGTVVEGEAQNIVPDQKTSKVVVKILHEDATTTDQMYFLHEVKPYRELNHPNILKLLGRCLETDPFLVLLEACPSGDLKSFLSQNIATAEALNLQGVTLQMCCNIASGLQHMHNNGFVHTDLAARNCLVTPDLTVKIGDYGTSIETFKEEYYCAGEVALPIRWCAPETLHCTETTIETKEVTPCANVWSLGVVLWEICEFGKLPYPDLSDDEVIVRVLGEGTQRLGLPSLLCPQRQNLYLLMKLCWRSMPERPLLIQVQSMLNHLYTNQERYNQDGDSSSLKTDEDFERRWEMFKPNTIPKTDNHLASPESTSITQSPARTSIDMDSRAQHSDETETEEDDARKSLNLAPAFDSMMTLRDSGNLTVGESSITPVTTSPQPSLASSSGGEFFIPTLQHRHKSPSLQNLRGSIDDLSESAVEVTSVTNWQKMGTNEEVDRTSDIVEEKENEANLLDEESNRKDVEVMSSEPDFDSWLKGVETTNEEDAKFVRKISEAIRDLDNALALEKTSSSSSSEASSKSVSHQSPAKDAATIISEQNVVLDFRLGRADSGVSSDDKEMIFQPDSFQDDSFTDNIKSGHLENRATDSGTDTEDETWRRRIERGEFSEKVKEKSKSVADLMVLTHIECSDGSDSEPPSLTWCFERSSNGRGSFTTRIRPGSFTKNVPTAFSSESNIHGAVLGEEFKDTLKKLHEAQREIGRTPKSNTIPDSSPLQRFSDTDMHSETSSVHSTNHNRQENFLAIDASEEFNKESSMTKLALDSGSPVNNIVLCPSEVKRLPKSDKIVGNSAPLDNKIERIDIENENSAPSSSSFSQVPVEDSTCSSVLTSSSVDNKNCGSDDVISVSVLDVSCNAPQVLQSSAIPREEIVKSVFEVVNDNVPLEHVIETSVNSDTSRLETEVMLESSSRVPLLSSETSVSSESHKGSGISLFASDNIFDRNASSRVGMEAESDVGNECKKSGSSPLFTSTPQQNNTKVGVTEFVDSSISRVLDYSAVVPDFSDTVSPFSHINATDCDTSAWPIDSSSDNTSVGVSASNVTSDSFLFSPANNISEQKTANNTDTSLPPRSSPDTSAIFNSVPPEADGVPVVPHISISSLSNVKNENKLPTAASDFVPSVVLGPCEDYTLDYFKGLKTTSGGEPVENISSNSEDISLYLGSSAFVDEKQEETLCNEPKPMFVDYCIDSWDKHLSTAFKEHEDKVALFDDISFKSEVDSLIDEEQLDNVSYEHSDTSVRSSQMSLVSGDTKEISSVVSEDANASDMPQNLSVDEQVANNNENFALEFQHTDDIVKSVIDFLEDSQNDEVCDHVSSSSEPVKPNIEETASGTKEYDSDGGRVTFDFMEQMNMSLPIMHSSTFSDVDRAEEHFCGSKMSGDVLTADALPLVQEKLGSADLCIPSLNFIAATPVPSGRNTPELASDAVNIVVCDATESAITSEEINPELSREKLVDDLSKSVKLNTYSVSEKKSNSEVKEEIISFILETNFETVEEMIPEVSLSVEDPYTDDLSESSKVVNSNSNVDTVVDRTPKTNSNFECAEGILEEECVINASSNVSSSTSENLESVLKTTEMCKQSTTPSEYTSSNIPLCGTTTESAVVSSPDAHNQLFSYSEVHCPNLSCDKVVNFEFSLPSSDTDLNFIKSSRDLLDAERLGIASEPSIPSGADPDSCKSVIPEGVENLNTALESVFTPGTDSNSVTKNMSHKETKELNIALNPISSSEADTTSFTDDVSVKEAEHIACEPSLLPDADSASLTKNIPVMIKETEDLHKSCDSMLPSLADRASLKEIITPEEREKLRTQYETVVPSDLNFTSFKSNIALEEGENLNTACEPTLPSERASSSLVINVSSEEAHKLNTVCEIALPFERASSSLVRNAASEGQENLNTAFELASSSERMSSLLVTNATSEDGDKLNTACVHTLPSDGDSTSFIRSVVPEEMQELNITFEPTSSDSDFTSFILNAAVEETEKLDTTSEPTLPSKEDSNLLTESSVLEEEVKLNKAVEPSLYSDSDFKSFTRSNELEDAEKLNRSSESNPPSSEDTTLYARISVFEGGETLNRTPGHLSPNETENVNIPREPSLCDDSEPSLFIGNSGCEDTEEVSTTCDAENFDIPIPCKQISPFNLEPNLTTRSIDVENSEKICTAYEPTLPADEGISIMKGLVLDEADKLNTALSSNEKVLNKSCEPSFPSDPESNLFTKEVVLENTEKLKTSCKPPLSSEELNIQCEPSLPSDSESSLFTGNEVLENVEKLNTACEFSLPLEEEKFFTSCEPSLSSDLQPNTEKLYTTYGSDLPSNENSALLTKNIVLDEALQLVTNFPYDAETLNIPFEPNLPSDSEHSLFVKNTALEEAENLNTACKSTPSSDEDPNMIASVTVETENKLPVSTAYEVSLPSSTEKFNIPCEHSMPSNSEPTLFTHEIIFKEDERLNTSSKQSLPPDKDNSSVTKDGAFENQEFLMGSERAMLDGSQQNKVPLFDKYEVDIREKPRIEGYSFSVVKRDKSIVPDKALDIGLCNEYSSSDLCNHGDSNVGTTNSKQVHFDLVNDKVGLEVSSEYREPEKIIFDGFKCAQSDNALSDTGKLDFEKQENSICDLSTCKESVRSTEANLIQIEDVSSRISNAVNNGKCFFDNTDCLEPVETKHSQSLLPSPKGSGGRDIMELQQILLEPLEIASVLERDVDKVKSNSKRDTVIYKQEPPVQTETKCLQLSDLTTNNLILSDELSKEHTNINFNSYKQAVDVNQFQKINNIQDITKADAYKLHVSNDEEKPVEIIALSPTQSPTMFSDKETRRVVSDPESWKHIDSNSRTLMEDFLLGERLASGITDSGLGVKTEVLPETYELAGETEEDGEDFGLDVVKHSTPDDERSSDSGFRDKGSLSESCEDACDEKYNLEDIEAELEETFNKGGFNYVEKHDEGNNEEHQRKLSSSRSLDDSASFNCIEKPEDEDHHDRTLSEIQRKLSAMSSDDSAYTKGDFECLDNEQENSSDKTLLAVEEKVTPVMVSLEDKQEKLSQVVEVSSVKHGEGHICSTDELSEVEQDQSRIEHVDQVMTSEKSEGKIDAIGEVYVSDKGQKQFEPIGERKNLEMISYKYEPKSENLDSCASNLPNPSSELSKTRQNAPSVQSFQEETSLISPVLRNTTPLPDKYIQSAHTQEDDQLVFKPENLSSHDVPKNISVIETLESEKFQLVDINFDTLPAMRKIDASSNVIKGGIVEKCEPSNVHVNSNADLHSLPNMDVQPRSNAFEVMTADNHIPNTNLFDKNELSKAVSFTSIENDISLLTEKNMVIDTRDPNSDLHTSFKAEDTSKTPESESQSKNSDSNFDSRGSGWYLHPPVSYNEKDERGQTNFDEYASPMNSGSSFNSKFEDSNNSENSYVSYSLDEEFVTAIRNELRDKLPCARQQRQEEDSEDGILDPEDDLSEEDRTDIMIHYNTYPAPLSPILEERESVSSITTTLSDHCSPFASSNKREVQKSGSDSESSSPVFVLDPKDDASKAQYEVDAKKFEQEIREALENCSLSSEDTSSSCDKARKESSVLFEDLEHQPPEDAQKLTVDVTVNGKNVIVVRGTNRHPEDDDVLVVNTETNEATLLESPKPKSHLAFVNSRRLLQENISIDELSATPDFYSDDEMTVGVNSETFIIEKSRFNSTFEADPKLGTRKEMSSDDEAYTPDSISPEHAIGTPSASTLQSPDTENMSDFFLTPSEKSPATTDCLNSPHGPQNSTVYNPYFLHSLSRNHNNPTFEEVQEISLGVANNEAAEIISELESSGILNSNNNVNNNNNNSNNADDKDILSATLPLCEKMSVEELPSSRASSTNENSEILSVEDSSEASESSRKDFEDRKLSAVDRLEYLTSPNLDVFSLKMKESVKETQEAGENLLNGNSFRERLLLNDTLDLLKRRKESRQNNNEPYQEDEEKDWSLPNLDASLLSTKAPMPSPEEESWKQIPSMLAFSDLNEVMSRCDEETFGKISFSGPTNRVPYGGQAEVDEGDLMSTSFSIKADPDDPECYTPDWESESDETNEEDNNSSSSGEFIWKEGDRESSVKAVDMSATSSTGKPYEGLSDFPMEVIAEEEEDEEDDEDADGSSSSGSGTEFVPSAWNSEATPNRSALRSPDKKSDQKKNVSFKKQKYHCVYEYPRETSDSDSEGFDSPTRRWNNLMYQSSQQPQVDYSSFADWELMDGDVLPEGSGVDTDTDQDAPENTSQQQQQLDFYKLSSVDYDFANGMVSEDGEFYISSSARPFQFPGNSSDILTNSASQFFPGQLYHVGSECKPATSVDDVAVDFVTPDSGIIDVAVVDKLSTLETGVDSYEDEVDTSPSSIARFAVSFNDQLVSHKLNSIKGVGWDDGVDLDKTSVDENSSGKSPTVTSDVGEKISAESVKVQELPFMEFLDLARVPEAKPNMSSMATIASEVTMDAKTVCSAVVADNDKDSETVPQSPSSPLSPSGLGELRHTRDRLKLDLPTTSTAFVLDPPAVGKRRSVETVKGEASLLDSGEETEDSGIESSNGAVTSVAIGMKSGTDGYQQDIKMMKSR